MSLEFEHDEFSLMVWDPDNARVAPEFLHCKHFCYNSRIIEAQEHERSVCCTCNPARDTAVPCTLCRRSDQRPRP